MFRVIMPSWRRFIFQENENAPPEPEEPSVI
jgi:hypothetical protein